MKPRSVCAKLNEFLVDGYSGGVFLAFQNHVLQETAGDQQNLGPVINPTMISPGGVSLDEFLRILDDDTYSAVFHDGAVVIVQCRFSKDRISSHRYTYIPCPVNQTILDARPEEITLSDWIREIAMDPVNNAFRSRGTYRFDYSDKPVKSSKDPHPISHFTFGSPDCRLPVLAPLSPSDFFGILFENFYRRHVDIWNPVSPHLHCSGTEESISKDEKKLFHLHRIESA